MREPREHWVDDRPANICWADRAGQSATQTPCNRTNVGRLGLCPMHEAEIAGVDGWMFEPGVAIARVHLSEVA